jgi:hypothetical protein
LPLARSSTAARSEYPPELYELRVPGSKRRGSAFAASTISAVVLGSSWASSASSRCGTPAVWFISCSTVIRFPCTYSGSQRATVSASESRFSSSSRVAMMIVSGFVIDATLVGVVGTNGTRSS